MVGITAGDVQGQMKIGLDVERQRRVAAEQQQCLRRECLCALPVETQSGTDEHERQETGRDSRIADGDIAVEKQTVQRVGILLTGLVALLVVDTAAEDVEQGCLCLTDELPTDDVLRFLLSLYIGKPEVRQFQLTGALKQLDAQRQADAVGHVLHGHDPRTLSIEDSVGLDIDIHVGGYIANR